MFSTYNPKKTTKLGIRIYAFANSNIILWQYLSRSDVSVTTRI